MATLHFTLNDGNEFVFDLLEARVTLGSHSGNDIVIENSSIEGFHAEFVRQQDGRYEIINLAGSNKVMVNSQPTDRRVLKGGCRLQFGDLSARYRDTAQSNPGSGTIEMPTQVPQPEVLKQSRPSGADQASSAEEGAKTLNELTRTNTAQNAIPQPRPDSASTVAKSVAGEPAPPHRRGGSLALSASECDIFISSASEDYPYAQQVYDFFAAQGFRVFFAGRSLRDSEYSRIIQQAIATARHMFVVTSAEAHVNKRWVEEEWTTYHDYLMKGKKERGQLATIWCGTKSDFDLPPFLSRREVFSLDDLERLLGYLSPKL